MVKVFNIKDKIRFKNWDIIWLWILTFIGIYSAIDFFNRMKYDPKAPGPAFVFTFGSVMGLYVLLKWEFVLKRRIIIKLTIDVNKSELELLTVSGEIVRSNLKEVKLITNKYKEVLSLKINKKKYPNLKNLQEYEQLCEILEANCKSSCYF